MSKNSRQGLKMNKRFEMEEKQRRERRGLPTAAPGAPELQPEPMDEVLDSPAPRTPEGLASPFAKHNIINGMKTC
jgi:hypothetical protein